MCLLRGTFYILRSAHTVYLCVLCGSQNKQRLFHCTALTDWLDFITDEMCLLRGTFYILRSAHTVHLCVLCGSQNKQRLFHCTALTDWLVFVTETECVYCAVVLHSTFCPQCIFFHNCHNSNIFIYTLFS